MVQVNLTEQEWDLIETIRNFIKTKNYNYSYDLEDYARQLFDNMMDIENY